MGEEGFTVTHASTNLRTYVVQVLAALDGARLDTTATHVHCGVQVDALGSTNCGPVLGYQFTDDGEDFGWVEIRNWEGRAVRKPFRLAKLHDVRPCWDFGCDPARTTKPEPLGVDAPGGPNYPGTPAPAQDPEPESAPRVNPDSRGPLREEAETGYDPYAGTGDYDDGF